MNRDRLEYANARNILSEVVPLDTPYVLLLDPCGACNFKCKFCPCNNSDYLSQQRHEVMDMELFQKILADIEEFPQQIKVINLYGFGEPLLHRNYVEMAKEIKDRNLCRELRCTTNGYMLSPELNRKLVSTGIDMIRISVEALTNEDYGDICDVSMDFKILNVALRDEKDAEHFYDIFEPISDYTYIQDTTQAWAEFEAYVPKGNYEAGNIGDMMDEDKICSFSLTNMAIHSNGSVGVCPQDWKFATEYGNVRKTALLELWNSKKLRGFQIAHLSGNRRKIPYCRDCDVCVSNDDVRKYADKIIERIKHA